MRRYPMFNETGRQKSTQTVFGGVNLTDGITEGEWEDTKNITTDNFPILSNRAKRGLVSNAISGKRVTTACDDLDEVYSGMHSSANNVTEFYKINKASGEATSGHVRTYGNVCGSVSTNGQTYVAGHASSNGKSLLYAWPSGDIDWPTDVPAEAVNANMTVQNYIEKDGVTHKYSILIYPADAEGKAYNAYETYHEASWYDTHTPQRGDIRLQHIVTTDGSLASQFQMYDTEWTNIQAECTVMYFMLYNATTQDELYAKDITKYFSNDWSRVKVEIPNGSFNGENTLGNVLANVLGLTLKRARMSQTYRGGVVEPPDLDTWVGYLDMKRNGTGYPDGIYLEGSLIIRGLDTNGVGYQFLNGYNPQLEASRYDAFMQMSRSTNIDDADSRMLCIYNNRMWMCSKDGHEIYCSRLGDFLTWDAFEGISTDSWTATVGSEGEFTGAIAFDDTPIFFKRDKMYRVYVSSTGAHQLKEASVKGVQRGCEGSLAIINNILYWKSETEICAFSGSTPYSVSDALGNLIHYSDAHAGAYHDKYYISMLNKQTMEYEMFCYDTTRGIWIREDNTRAKCFTGSDGNLYFWESGAIEDRLLCIDGEHGTETEESISWEVKTGPYSYVTPNQHYIDRLSLRLTLAEGAMMSVFVSYDDGEWEHLQSLSGARTRTFTMPIKPHRCDHFRLKFTGEGDFKIMNITKTTEEGSDIAW